MERAAFPLEEARSGDVALSHESDPCSALGKMLINQ